MPDVFSSDMPSNKNFEQFFLDKVKPAQQKQNKKRNTLDLRAEVNVLFLKCLTKHKTQISTKRHKHKTTISKKVVETYLQEKCIQILSCNDNYNFLNIFSFRFGLCQNY